MATYVISSGMISPQQSWGTASLLAQPRDVDGDRMACVEPDYSSMVDVRQLRRMSRILKMGVASGFMALKDAEITLPDGIITGTGYGCLEDTGIFLTKMIENGETALNPTPFIQSTHNTIGSQIALLLGCQGYNQTYTQRSFSFENALLDALMAIEDSPNTKFLVGAVDEITHQSYSILKRFGILRRHNTSSLNLLGSHERGTILGEGAGYFVLSGEQKLPGDPRIEAVSTFFGDITDGISDWFERFVSKLGGPVDMVLSGRSGDSRNDWSQAVLSPFDIPVGFFKHLCGEYPSASTFACWLAVEILRTGEAPVIVMPVGIRRPLRRILIFNTYFGKYHSLICVSNA